MMRKVAVAAMAAMVMTPMTAEGQAWRTVTMSQQLESNDEVRVQVEFGAGRFTVRSVDEGLLYRMNLKYDEDSVEPVAELSGNRLRLGVESLGRSTRIRNRESGELELELARGVPMELDLEFGA
ncbi:MAG: toast rack family protein, partial [Longimicrobiales bacterium]